MHTRLQSLVVSLSLGVSLLAQQDGGTLVSGPVSSPHPYAGGAGVVWAHTFHNPVGTQARLDLSIDLGAGDVLVLKDFAGVEQWRYTGRGPQALVPTSAIDGGPVRAPSRFVSGPVNGSVLLAELIGRSGGHGVDVHGAQWRTTPVTAASSAGGCDVTEVMPAQWATAEANAGTSYPWNATVGQRAMYAYGATTAGFDRPVRICGVRYRPEGGRTSTNAVDYDFRLDLSTSRSPAQNLDRTFDNNHGADRTTVFDGVLSQPAVTGFGLAPNPFVLDIPFSTPFEWDPRCGPLLFDIVYRGGSASSGGTWDASSGTDDVGRIVHRTSANAATADFPSTGTQNAALIFELCLETDVTPVALTATEGGSSSSYPWNRSNPMRVMYGYDESTIDFAGRHKISSLSWRTNNGAAYPGASYGVRITMSTGVSPMTGLSTTFDSNHGADQTVVFEGVHVADPVAGTSSTPGVFSVTIPLTTPFEYNPAEGSLIVDLQLLTPPPATPGTSFDGDFGSEPVFRVYSIGSATATTGTAQHFALAMGLGAEPIPTLPETSDSSSNSSSSSYPWNATNPQRAMYQYGAGVMATTRPIYVQHLSWRPKTTGSFGPAAYTCTVDLSTSVNPAGTLVATFDSNHGADRARVFDSTFSVPYIADNSDRSRYPITLKLDTPFYYDPANGPLMVDIRLLAISGNTSPLDGGFNSLVERVVHLTDPNGAVANFGPQGFAIDLRLGGAGCNATSINYGAGCAGTNGTPSCVNVNLPTLPSPDFAVGMLDGPVNAFAFLTIGVTQASNPLAGLGAPGCFGLTGGEIGALGVPTDGNGEAFVPLPLPNSPAFSGFAFRTQWAGLDAGANALGIVFSDAQEHRTCY